MSVHNDVMRVLRHAYLVKMELQPLLPLMIHRLSVMDAVIYESIRTSKAACAIVILGVHVSTAAFTANAVVEQRVVIVCVVRCMGIVTAATAAAAAAAATATATTTAGTATTLSITTTTTALTALLFHVTPCLNVHVDGSCRHWGVTTDATAVWIRNGLDRTAAGDVVASSNQQRAQPRKHMCAHPQHRMLQHTRAVANLALLLRLQVDLTTQEFHIRRHPRVPRKHPSLAYLGCQHRAEGGVHEWHQLQVSQHLGNVVEHLRRRHTVVGVSITARSGNTMRGSMYAPR